MSKHTPGPWNYDSGYIDTHAVDDDGSRDYIILAEMHSTFGPDNYGVDQWMLPPEEYEANAHLIAVAPEMYELLERAGEIMNELESLIDNAFTNDASAQKSQWLKDADALLAKIEGGGDAA